mmetsp:Transcript_22486/g.60832  ORF Transcript_22486/g.60832 Transcript_22486/m.60832 type:complete len:209 (-) Transcript_22486:868-1494(-)
MGARARMRRRHTWRPRTLRTALAWRTAGAALNIRALALGAWAHVCGGRRWSLRPTRTRASTLTCAGASCQRSSPSSLPTTRRPTRGSCTRARCAPWRASPPCVPKCQGARSVWASSQTGTNASTACSGTWACATTLNSSSPARRWAGRSPAARSSAAQRSAQAWARSASCARTSCTWATPFQRTSAAPRRPAGARCGWRTGRSPTGPT